MKPLFNVEAIRHIESLYGSAGLMEKAGLAAANLIRELLADAAHAILIVAGPGNNGGDAFVTARYLKAWWYKVTLVFAGDPQKLPADALAAYDGWLACGGECVSDIPQGRWDLVVDGLFGIGLKRPLEGSFANLVKAMNRLDADILALDVPSGLDADTGSVLGVAVKATYTLTFLGLKPGLFTMDGPDHTGAVYVDQLGLPEPTSSAAGWLMESPPVLPAKRLLNSHKGRNGNLAVLGGSEGMVGAAILAAQAGLLVGAGRVFCGLLANHAPALDVLHPELMLRSAETLLDLEGLDVLAVGPGLGTNEPAAALLDRGLLFQLPLVLDADALNLLAAKPAIRELLLARPAHTTIITPHPGEAATILGIATAELQQDRIASALKIARLWGAITVLKGCGSIVATPAGEWFINGSGNPGLSSAGMGDTLTGIIAGLIAQGMPLLEAAKLGVYLHGAAADLLVKEGNGPFGLTASEVAAASRKCLNAWIYP